MNAVTDELRQSLEAKLRCLAEGIDTQRLDDFLDYILNLVTELVSVTCKLVNGHTFRVQSGDKILQEVKLPRGGSKLRMLCARLAARCNDWSSQKVSPYRDEIQFEFPRTKRIYRVRFENTAGSQWFAIEDALASPHSQPAIDESKTTNKTAKDTTQFLNLLRASNLLEDEDFEKAQRAPVNTPGEIVDWLVGNNLVTPWQAKELLQGQASFERGPYRLLEFVGAGAYGIVYRAVKVTTRWNETWQSVALKEVSPARRFEGRSIPRFQREIRANQQLEHPNIVRLLDVGDIFYVMEFIQGTSLESFIQLHPPSVPDACQLVRQAALGLHHAHEKEIVHGDVAESNLLVRLLADGSWQVKLTDFGFARILKDIAAGESHSGGIGHQANAAPETIRRQGKKIDHRADIFSLGTVFYRILTGKSPFEKRDIEWRLQNDAPSVRALNSAIPAKLDAIVSRMLRRNPAERFQTAQEFANALRPFLGRGETTEPACNIATTSWHEGAFPINKDEPTESSPKSLAQQQKPKTESISAIDIERLASQPEVGEIVQLAFRARMVLKCEWEFVRVMDGLEKLQDEFKREMKGGTPRDNFNFNWYVSVVDSHITRLRALMESEFDAWPNPWQELRTLVVAGVDEIRQLYAVLSQVTSAWNAASPVLPRAEWDSQRSAELILNSTEQTRQRVRVISNQIIDLGVKLRIEMVPMIGPK